MYLTILKIKPEKAKICRIFQNEEQVHIAIMMMVEKNREEEQVLYRTFDSDDIRNVRIIVQSKNKLNVSRSMYFDCVKSVCVDERNSLIEKGDIITFDILARPTSQPRRAGSPSHKKLIVGKDARINWITNRLAQGGCKALSVSENESEGKRLCHRDQKWINLDGLRYSGQIKIEDPDSLLKLYETGIGHGKAYGFGMLLLK